MNDRNLKLALANIKNAILKLDVLTVDYIESNNGAKLLYYYNLNLIYDSYIKLTQFAHSLEGLENGSD